MTFWAKYAQRTDVTGLARRGFMYEAAVERSIANGASASCAFTTGATATVIYLRESSTSSATVRFLIYESSGVTASGSVVGQNLDRTITGSGSVSLGYMSASATAMTLGTLIANELVPGGSKGGGGSAGGEVRTLKPSTTYVITMDNLDSQTTYVNNTFMWSENEPSPYQPLY